MTELSGDGLQLAAVHEEVGEAQMDQGGGRGGDVAFRRRQPPAAPGDPLLPLSTQALIQARRRRGQTKEVASPYGE